MIVPRLLRCGVLVGAVLATLFVTGAGCRSESSSRSERASGTAPPLVDYVAGIHDVLAIDGELGVLRNQATQSVSLVDAIRGYVAGIDSVDFSDCPDDFKAAFLWHRNAWAESVPFFEQFPELRGEMHQLFEEIRAGGTELRAELERVESPIWDSWAEVEGVAADYGAIEPGPIN